MRTNFGENMIGADNHAGKTVYADLPLRESTAYLFGVYLGDGCCSHTAKHHTFTIVSEDRDVVERTRVIINELLQKNYHLKLITPNRKELYRFRAWSKQLFLFLRNETANKTKLPEFVTNSNRKIMSEFVAGLLDTDGYISMGINQFGQQRFSLGFVNSAKWLDDFITLLSKLGVKVGKKTLKRKYRSAKEVDCYQVNINIRSFVEASLYFRCQRKQRILDEYKSSVRYQSYTLSSETNTPNTQAIRKVNGKGSQAVSVVK